MQKTLSLKRIFELKYPAIRQDIFKFAAEANFEPSSDQTALMNAVSQAQRGQNLRRISAKSGQGVGKTALHTICAIWRAIQHVDSETIITAPTMRQCKDVWLKEARVWIQKFPPYLQRLFDITSTKITIAGRPNWVIRTITATKPENAAGFHNPHLSFFIDETSGMDAGIMETIEGTLSNHDKLIFQIGNPTMRDTPFFNSFHKDAHRWNRFTLDARRSPHVSKENIEYLAEKYGEDSRVFKVRVLGEFPEVDPDCIMSMEDLEACTRNDKLKCSMAKASRHGVRRWHRQTGLDFAGKNGDRNVMATRVGLAITDLESYNNIEPEQLVNRAFKRQAMSRWSDDQVLYVPDTSGIGHGLLYGMQKKGKKTYDFKSHHRSSQSQYDNKATDAWFQLADLVKRREIYLPNHERLLFQLGNRHYDFTKKGKIIVEPKDMYQKRIVGLEEDSNSPDEADSVVQAYYGSGSGEGSVSLL